MPSPKNVVLLRNTETPAAVPVNTEATTGADSAALPPVAPDRSVGDGASVVGVSSGGADLPAASAGDPSRSSVRTATDGDATAARIPAAPGRDAHASSRPAKRPRPEGAGGGAVAPAAAAGAGSGAGGPVGALALAAAAVGKTDRSLPALRRAMVDAEKRRVRVNHELVAARTVLEAAQKKFDEASARDGAAEAELADAARAFGSEELDWYGRRGEWGRGPAWHQHYADLRKYGEEHGHLTVPCSGEAHSLDTLLLGRWLNGQRAARRRPVGDPKRIQPHIEALLDDIDVVWNPLDKSWENKIAELELFVRDRGHAFVRADDKPNLSAFVTKQRYNYTNKKLPQDRIKRLEDLGVVWKANEEFAKLRADALWNDRLRELKAYAEANGGDCDILPEDEDNRKLADWVFRQRDQYRHFLAGKEGSLMTAERVNILERMGFSWKEKTKACRREEAVWRTKINELIAYKAKHGNCMTGQGSKNMAKGSLGSWLNAQRKMYRKLKRGEQTSMTKEMVKTLEDIGMIWDPNNFEWDTR